MTRSMAFHSDEMPDHRSKLRRLGSGLACSMLLACGGAAVPAVGTGTQPGATLPHLANVPSSGPGSTRWEILLDFDGAGGSGLSPISADDAGDLFVMAVNGGEITAEKRDSSGAVLWRSAVEPACSHGFQAIGATPDGRFAAGVTYCPLGSAYRPRASRVTLLGAGGEPTFQLTTGWGVAVGVNSLGEVYAVSADAGSPVVPSPTGSALVSGAPLLLRLIRPDGTDAWVDRSGSLVPLPGSLQPSGDGGAVALTADGAAAFRVARSGSVLWRSALPVTVKPSAYPSTAALRDGSLVVAVETAGVVTFGLGQAGAAGRSGRALLVVGSDGRPRTIVPVPASAPGESWTVVPAALADGGLVVWEPLARCARIWAFSSELTLRWERQLDEACSAGIASAIGARDGPVLAIWRWSGPDRLAGAPYLLSLRP